MPASRAGSRGRPILVGVILASALQLFSIPAFAALSDRLGRRPVYLAGALFLGLFAFPFFWLVDSGVPVLIWLALVLGLTGVAAMYGPQAAFFSELFGTNVRYSGASLGSQLAAPFAGGLAPLIATALLELVRRPALACRPVHDRHGPHHLLLRLPGRGNSPDRAVEPIGSLNFRFQISDFRFQI